MYRPLLALVAQYLTIPGSASCLALESDGEGTGPLPAAAFSHDSLSLPHSALPTAAASSLPLVARLVPCLAFRYTSSLRCIPDDELLGLLHATHMTGHQQVRSAERRATFPYQRELELSIPYSREQAALQLPFHWASHGFEEQPPARGSFPRLAWLRLTLTDKHGSWLDSISLHSLQLLPRLLYV